MKIRDYQSKAVDAIFKEWNENVSTLLVMPTGTGKTAVFSFVTQKRGGRAIVIAHRQELVFQARETIERITGLNCEVEMGDYRAASENHLFKKSSVIVSSVQTLSSGGDGGGRMTKFDPMEIDTMIIDEFHHSTAKSYRKVIDWFRTNPNLRILGVTATPDRADEEALGQVCDSVAFDYEILDAIRDGWLVPINQQMVTVSGLDYSNIRTTAGDLNGADLSAVMESEKNLHGVASSSIEIVGQKRALVFTASVNHARMLAEIYNRHRAGMAAWVSGATDKEDRKKILSDFQLGKIQVVCNCNVLTEGFDDPGVEVVVMARPTKSRSLYAQMIGRATRALPGIVDGPSTPIARRFAIARSRKNSCLVVDYSGNSGRHKLITTADILGGNVSEEAIDAAVEFARRTGKQMRMDSILEDEEKRLADEKEKKRLEDEARRANIVLKADYKVKGVDPFALLDIRPQTKERGWDVGKTFTEKQSAFLRRNGIDPDKITYGQGKQLMAAMGQRREQNLCTLNQMKTLKKYGIETNVTFEHASKIIDAIAQNGWRKPEVLPQADSLKSEPAFEEDNTPF